jgi:hypothetical protein
LIDQSLMTGYRKTLLASGGGAVVLEADAEMPPPSTKDRKRR